ncbi:MAG: CDP-alcohol phosphatidyltransferase family protein [Geminicoccaceae bacterium]
MFDARLRRVIDPPLNRIGRSLAGLGLNANTTTLTGFAFGLLAIAAIALGQFGLGLGLLLLNRLADGIDGAVARHAGITDLGGYLDIVCDFIVYAGIVFAFALVDPEDNALAAAFLVFSFMGTGSSFLAFATIAAKRGLTTQARGHKTLYYLGGLTEGFETATFLVLCCLFPGQFTWMAWVFGAMCWVTTISRIAQAFDAFDEPHG